MLATEKMYDYYVYEFDMYSSQLEVIMIYKTLQVLS